MPMADYTVNQYYRIKEKEYVAKWPMSDRGNPDRTITLYDDDVLTKDPDNGTYMKHTGIACFNIQIPDDMVEFVDKPAELKGV